MSLLEVDAVVARYNDFQALSEVTVRVEEGEVLAIVGANGAGKSTLLGSIAGVVEVSAGTLTYDGRPLQGLAPHRRVGLGIAMVPEGRRLFPSLSVQENLQVGAHRRRPGPWDLERVLELLPLLAPLTHRPAGTLSGGEQQAVAIGRALMSNPRLLLLDEVSLGLAPIVVRQLYQALPAIVGAGITVLLVEQDITQATASADRIYCLQEGRIALHGRPADLSRAQITRAYFGATS